jgi:hypothetical protein
MRDYSTCHLAELDNSILNLYGPRSLDAMDKNWGDRTTNSVETISFRFINFHDIVPRLKKICGHFPSLMVRILKINKKKGSDKTTRFNTF